MISFIRWETREKQKDRDLHSTPVPGTSKNLVTPKLSVIPLGKGPVGSETDSSRTDTAPSALSGVAELPQTHSSGNDTSPVKPFILPTITTDRSR